ncbi:MAG: hypothetical protein GY842_13025, partial [bacterium]|nr:hypothetical protein [bacterium]
HFDTPRISGLFVDLDPAQAGRVIWKQYADRMVVTWDGVTEHNGSNSNTFQMELYFDGKIQVSYLTMDAAEGIAGLSAGGGQPAEYYPSDLSGLEDCGPKPPEAFDANLNTPVYVPLDITLGAIDDGDPGPLDYIVLSLPSGGVLEDTGTGLALDSVPYTLAGGGNRVDYLPYACFNGADGFTFKVNDGGTPPEGGDSNEASVSISVTLSAGSAQMRHSFPLDSDPGWATEGQWEFGVPQGGGSHHLDPTSGHTGSNVYGYNLAGDYPRNMSTTLYLTAGPLDCTDQLGTELRFRRWLGVEDGQFDNAYVEVSDNGTDWTVVWENPEADLDEEAWSLQTYDLSSVADGESTVYVRWGMGTTDGSVTYPGWNLDDVEIWGVPVSPIDYNGDSLVDSFDYSMLESCLSGPSGVVP